MNDLGVLIIGLLTIFAIGIGLALVLKEICEASGWKDGSYK